MSPKVPTKIEREDVLEGDEVIDGGNGEHCVLMFTLKEQ